MEFWFAFLAICLRAITEAFRISPDHRGVDEFFVGLDWPCLVCWQINSGAGVESVELDAEAGL